MESEPVEAQMRPMLLELCQQLQRNELTVDEFLDYADEAVSLHSGGWQGLQGTFHATHYLRREQLLTTGTLLRVSTHIWGNYDHAADIGLQLDLLKGFKVAGSISGITYAHLCSLRQAPTGVPICSCFLIYY